MKPFGLEGKVGAPAIIRTNPLLALYDRAFAECVVGQCDWDVIDPLLDAVSPILWDDLLGVLQSRYRGVNSSALTQFAYRASQRVPDPVLHYDLPLPMLELSIAPYRRMDRVVVSRGEVDRLNLGPKVNSIISGTVRELSMEGNLSIVEGSIADLNIHPNSYAVAARDAHLQDARLYLRLYRLVGLPDEMRSGPSMLVSGTRIRYRVNHIGAVCSPDESAAIRALYVRCLTVAGDPVAFLDEIPRLRRRFQRAHASNFQRIDDRRRSDLSTLQWLVVGGSSGAGGER